MACITSIRIQSVRRLLSSQVSIGFSRFYYELTLSRKLKEKKYQSGNCQIWSEIIVEIHVKIEAHSWKACSLNEKKNDKEFNSDRSDDSAFSLHDLRNKDCFSHQNICIYKHFIELEPSTIEEGWSQNVCSAEWKGLKTSDWNWYFPNHTQFLLYELSCYPLELIVSFTDHPSYWFGQT